MTNPSLPDGHHRELLTLVSPAVIDGCLCPITGQLLRAGDEVIVCDARHNLEPILIDGWTTLAACPHCGAMTGLVAAYLPSTWAVTRLPATRAVSTPASAPRLAASALLIGLAALLLVSALVIGGAAILFTTRTRDPDDVDAATVVAIGTVATATSPATNTVAPSLTAVAAASHTAEASTRQAFTLATSTAEFVIRLTAVAATQTAVASTTNTEVDPATPTATGLPPSPVSDLWLINPATDRAVRALRANDSIDLSREGLSSLNFRADLSPGPGMPVVESVVFHIDGVVVCSHGNCVENSPPYALGGDQNGDYYDDWAWTDLLGSHVISIFACSGEHATGQCAAPFDVQLSVSR